MPPHQPACPPLPDSSSLAWRGVKLLILASSLALTGCAAQRQSTQTADALELHLRAERDNYLAQTKSDPLGARYSHVGIYLGNGEFVHAPRTGASVRVESMDIAYWKKRYNGARRLAANGVAHTDQ